MTMRNTPGEIPISPGFGGPRDVVSPPEPQYTSGVGEIGVSPEEACSCKGTVEEKRFFSRVPGEGV